MASSHALRKESLLSRKSYAAVLLKPAVLQASLTLSPFIRQARNFARFVSLTTGTL
jgi:hypothetical protein